MSDLTEPGNSALPERVARRVPERVTRYRKRSRSENTQRAYTADWIKWGEWCRRNDRASVPADPVDVADYIAESADMIREDGSYAYSAATLSRWVASIGFWHAEGEHVRPGVRPVVSDVLAGIRRERAQSGVRPVSRQAKPMLLADLQNTLRATSLSGWPMGVIGFRDRAMLLVGWVGALRSDNVADLNIADLTWHPDDGLWLRLRRSKTDQQGKGRTIALPRGRHVLTCAPCAVTRWMLLLLAAESALDAGEEQRPAVIAKHAELLGGRRQHVCLIAPEGVDSVDLNGPLFRSVHKTGSVGERRLSPEALNHVVKGRAHAAGLRGFTSHSLRAGFVTEASRQGLSTEAIMRQTGQSKDTVEIYRRHQNPLEANAVTEMGL